MGSTWTALVPVKRLADAKSRLALPSAQRRSLAVAMALDTIGAVRSVPSVTELVVVSSDQQLARALAPLPVTLVADEPGGGLNAALGFAAHQVRRRRAGAALVAVTADLPALRGEELGAVLAGIPAGSRAFVRDVGGTGTTLLAASGGCPLDPAFGSGSAERHRRSGAVELALPARGLRHDIDTVADLAAAAGLRLGGHTRQWLTVHRAQHQHTEPEAR